MIFYGHVDNNIYTWENLINLFMCSFFCILAHLFTVRAALLSTPAKMAPLDYLKVVSAFIYDIFIFHK